jgi:RND family efflux transporter MFP subunit
MKSGFRSLAFVFFAAFALAIYFLGIRPRVRASAELDTRAREQGHRAVNVMIAKRADLSSDLILPASLQPILEAPIYARTNGYLSRLLVDIGDKVKAGQVLGIIEAPELDQELNQTRAALEQAKANSELAHTSATRWKDLGKENAVSQQEVDEKQAAYAARLADVHAAEANVSRLTQLKQYQTITAPFDGVISARNIDIGGLVSAGGGGRELFRLAQTDTLRVYANVPQSYTRLIQAGIPVDISVNEFPGREFTGKVVRVAGALEPTSRTLLAEVQIPNAKNELLAGMFGQMHFRLQGGEPPLIVPSNAVVLRGDGTSVVTVGADNTIHYQKVKLGRDFGTQVEVVGGLADQAHVVSNPSDALTDGLVVDPLLSAPAAAAKKS